MADLLELMKDKTIESRPANTTVYQHTVKDGKKLAEYLESKGYQNGGTFGADYTIGDDNVLYLSEKGNKRLQGEIETAQAAAEKLAAAQKIIENREEQIVEGKKAQGNLRHENKQLDEKLSSTEAALSSANNALSKEREALRATSQQLNQEKETTKGLRADLKSQEEKLAQEYATEKDLRAQLEQQAAELKRTQEALAAAQAKIAQNEKALTETEQTLTQTQKALTETQQALTQTQGDLTKANKALEEELRAGELKRLEELLAQRKPLSLEQIRYEFTYEDDMEKVSKLVAIDMEIEKLTRVKTEAKAGLEQQVRENNKQVVEENAAAEAKAAAELAAKQEERKGLLEERRSAALACQRIMEGVASGDQDAALDKLQKLEKKIDALGLSDSRKLIQADDKGVEEQVTKEVASIKKLEAETKAAERAAKEESERASAAKKMVAGLDQNKIIEQNVIDRFGRVFRQQHVVCKDGAIDTTELAALKNEDLRKKLDIVGADGKGAPDGKVTRADIERLYRDADGNVNNKHVDAFIRDLGKAGVKLDEEQKPTGPRVSPGSVAGKDKGKSVLGA